MELTNGWVLAVAGTVVGFILSLVAGALLARWWMTRQGERVLKQVRALLASDLRAAREELRAQGERLAREVAAPREPGRRPALPVDRRMVEAAEQLYPAMIAWAKSLAQLSADDYRNYHELVDPRNGGVEARIALYYDESRNAFFHARALMQTVRDNALYLDDELYGQLEELSQQAFGLSRNFFLAAQRCRELSTTLAVQDFSRLFGMVEAARVKLVDFCDVVFIARLRDDVAPRLRQIRSLYGLRLEQAGT